MIAFIRHLH